MIHYLAYGSNLHPLRLMERIPSAKLIGAVELTGRRLTFHKKSNDGSGKCNIPCSRTDSAYGAVYELDPGHRQALHRIEGRGAGYSDEPIDVLHGGRRYSCFTYLAQRSHVVPGLKPYHWYKELVVLGARYLEFPDPYVTAIESIESVADANAERSRDNAALIGKIIDHHIDFSS